MYILNLFELNSRASNVRDHTFFFIYLKNCCVLYLSFPYNQLNSFLYASSWEVTHEIHWCYFNLITFAASDSFRINN